MNRQQDNEAYRCEEERFLLIPVLIRTRERCQPLLRCLEDVLDQHYCKLEVLVVDAPSCRYNIYNIIAKQIISVLDNCLQQHNQGYS